MKTSCYTYFAIKGSFVTKEITKILTLQPTKCWSIGDKRKNSDTYYDFSLWEYGRCNTYEIDVELQCLKTIEELKSKIKELQYIKQNNDVDFVLEIVPSIYIGETHPAIGFNREIIEFCYLTGTYIDIDMYVYDDDD